MIDDVGSRLRELREARGLSQRELAKRAGVTNAMISLIETNKVSPTIASLRKVLDGLPVSMIEFFSEADQQSARPQYFYRQEEMLNVGREGVTMRMVGERHPERNICVLHEVYEVGADTGEEMIAHPGEEGGVVLKGRVEITINGECRVLGAGEGYYFDTSLPHRFRNVGRGTAELVSAATPPSY